MEGGEDQVPCEGSPDCHLRCRRIPQFSHHDDVRILPQDVPQAAGKIQADLRLDLNPD